MEKIFTWIESLISGALPFSFLIFCGIYLTIKSKFFQFRNFGNSISYAMGGLFKKEKLKTGLSPFESACTALSATIGTGNIAGVAGAISLGGAGAIFWMWISAIAGMSVKSAEILLALKYRENNNGSSIGGPMYYIKKGLPKIFAPLSYIFSFVGIFAVISSGNLTQTNTASNCFSGQYQKLILGIVFTIVTFIVMIGGMKRIGNFSAKIVPIMSVLYIIMSLSIIIINIDNLPIAVKKIFEGAFNPSAVTGGVIGSFISTVTTGSSRGVFSNESGLGTSAMAHGASEKTDGQKQCLYGIFEIFIDTIFLCTLTALTILCSGINIEYGIMSSTDLVIKSLSVLYGKMTNTVLSLMMFLFGLSSVIGWGLYGITCSQFLMGNAGKRIFIIIYPISCMIGAMCKVETVWRLSAFFNGILLCINVFAVLMLNKDALNEMSKVKIRRKKNEQTKKVKSSA